MNKEVGYGSRRRSLFLVVLFAVVVLAGLGAYFFLQPILSGSESREAPNFSLIDIYGNRFQLLDFRGRVVLLEFMFTRCWACGEQIPFLKAIAEKYDNKTEAVIIMISVRPSSDTDEVLREYVQTHGITWVVARDHNLEVADMYNVQFTPTLFIIGKDGAVRYKHVGVTSSSTLSSEIDELLKGAEPSVSVGEMLTMLAAFGAGLASFSSPCVLPILPSFLAYMTGASENPHRGFLGGVAYALGLSITFTLLGILFSGVGRAIPSRFFLKLLGGVLLVAFGFSLLGVINISFLLRTASPPKKLLRRKGVLGALLLGLVFGFLWIPCVTPVLTSILVYVSVQGRISYGGTLLFMYGLGFSTPLIFLSASLATLKKVLVQKAAKIGHYLESICGLILIALGVGMMLSLLNLPLPFELFP